MNATTNQWVTCPQCRTSYDPARGGCPRCVQAKIQNPLTQCPHCGRSRINGARFCDGCGRPLDMPGSGTYGGFHSNRLDPANLNECPQCHGTVPLEAARCPGCKSALSSLRELYGAPFTGDLILCESCKARLPASIRFCEKCGTRIEKPRIIAREKNLLARPSVVFWRRFSTALVDHFFVVLFSGGCLFFWSILCSWLLFMTATEEGPDPKIVFATFLGTLFFIVAPYPFYLIVSLTHLRGQSYAGRLFNTRVIREDGYRLSHKVSLLRFIGTMLSWLTFGMGFLMAAFRDDGKTLADLISKTRLVEDHKIR